MSGEYEAAQLMSAAASQMREAARQMQMAMDPFQLQQVFSQSQADLTQVVEQMTQTVDLFRRSVCAMVETMGMQTCGQSGPSTYAEEAYMEVLKRYDLIKPKEDISCPKDQEPSKN